MTANGCIQIAIFFGLLLLTVKPLGRYMTDVFEGRTTFLAPVERVIYRICGVDAREEQHWTVYGVSMLLFSLAGFLSLYALMRLQAMLPYNPQHLPALSEHLSFNTAMSFITNTNWQSYVPETTMSYLVQMAGLTVHNFVSAATGIALALALIRGFARRQAATVGNFWIDLTRCTLYILIPISIAAALFFVWQGMPQNLGAYVDATTLEGGKQTIAMGPVASQEAIKMLGTNGGGFFNANSSHPFENPNALTNLVQMLLIFSLGAALTNVFGRMVGDQRQGWAVLAVMAVLFLAGTAVVYWAEAPGNPAFAAMQVDQSAGPLQAGGNMEGKEVRFGIADSALFTTVTTDASCGAVNTMHDSLMPLGGFIPMLNIQLGEIIFGGVGSGLYGMLLFAIVAVFVAGLMVGRTPEYLGKKIEAREVKMAMLAILVLPLSILGFSALATVLPAGLAGPANAGPHGYSEILYAYTSATGNNGSAFAGISANTMFYNVTIGFAMLIGRFLMIVPMLAVAGSLAQKKILPPSAGTFPTHGALFVGLVVGVILIVGGLTYFPALALGPIVEHFAMLAGNSY
ncbi:MAG TPA: potassium-transporting ATPase subunit KdpA [Rhizomicrobium sp.]|jgi:K+-transporting ATPase ATPase A chain|nr:potassium-transporting ATPase subunit KdpA [Rhizomicrobium sp.]